METLVGESDWARDLREQIERVGHTCSTVLITGPTGTGKELIAKAIHEHSPRRDKPFVTVDCAAIAPSLIASQLFGHVKGAFTGADYPSVGFFRAADGGTIFLDEIGELAAESQAKLLRVIQERTVVPVGAHKAEPVDVRIVAATNRDLHAEAADGKFRTDLIYRLNVVPLATTPLYNRTEDIPLLAEHFLARLSVEAALPLKTLSPAACKVLKLYSWPGNVRQLQNVLERAVLFCESAVIEADLIARFLSETKPPEPKRVETPEPVAPNGSDESWPSLAQCEGELIRRTLEHTHHNRSAAAHLLRIDYRRLNRLIDKYGLTDQLNAVSRPKPRCKPSSSEAQVQSPQS